MKTLMAVILLMLSSMGAVPAFAEAPVTPSPATASAEAWTEGTVKKVDTAAGKVTLRHGPLKNLDMPGMTMVFRVKESTWLDEMKAGDQIRFVADKVNGAFTVVQFEPVAANEAE
ncbi:MAG: copper-binding protein [Gammaproteobacteria bacterium]|jgi:Cu/Ag efflux protein CusF|nr:copper-binding protein [Gammaproteobacteria bacterium]